MSRFRVQARIQDKLMQLQNKLRYCNILFYIYATLMIGLAIPFKLSFFTEETEGKQDVRIAAVQSSEPNTGMFVSAFAVCAMEKPADGLSFVSRLDLKKTVYNCTNFQKCAKCFCRA